MPALLRIPRTKAKKQSTNSLSQNFQKPPTPRYSSILSLYSRTSMNEIHSKSRLRVWRRKVNKLIQSIFSSWYHCRLLFLMRGIGRFMGYQLKWKCKSVEITSCKSAARSSKLNHRINHNPFRKRKQHPISRITTSSNRNNHS